MVDVLEKAGYLMKIKEGRIAAASGKTGIFDKNYIEYATLTNKT